MAEKKRQKRPCQITFRQDRLVLSRTAAENLPEFVDMYECGNILALKGNVDGQIRLSVGSHKYRQNIRIKEVLDVIRKKFGCEAGDVLSAWYRGDVLMFSKRVTLEEAKVSFNDHFEKIEMQTRPPEPYGVRTRSFVTALSGTAGRLFEGRLTVYEYGDILAFVPDESGSLQPVVEKDGRTKSIHSKELTDFIREKYVVTEAALTGWEKDGVLLCAEKRSVARISFDKSSFIRHDFQMNTECATVNILQNSRLLVSNLGASILRDNVNLYEHGNILALVNDPEGEFRVIRNMYRSGCDVTGRDLVRYIKEKFNLQEDAKKLMSAVVRADVVYFSDKKITYIPALKRFERVAFDRVCSFHVVSVTLTPTGNGKFYISEAARQHLSGPVSAYRKGDIWAFAAAPDGKLNMSSMGFISSRELAQIMKSELHFERAQRFYMKVCDGKVFFSTRRFRDDDKLDISGFEKVM